MFKTTIWENLAAKPPINLKGMRTWVWGEVIGVVSECFSVSEDPPPWNVPASVFQIFHWEDKHRSQTSVTSGASIQRQKLSIDKMRQTENMDS